MIESGQSTLSTDITIRFAVDSDAPFIYDFICTLEETALDKVVFDTIFRTNLRNPLIHYLVADRLGKVLGFVSCHIQYLLHHGGKVGEIQELFVRPEARNQLIGHQLVDALTTLAIQEGFVNLEVTTNQKRTDTIRFYEREAFSRTHVKLVKPLFS
jgi:PhnO protein